MELLSSASIVKYIKVLFVEDEDKTREYIEYTLKYFVREVMSVSNGAEAMEAIEKFMPDVIITDLKMPKLNGVEFIKTARSLNKSIPIIVITGYTDKSDLIDLVNLQITSYLHKPVDSKELFSALAEAAQSLENQGKLHLKITNNIIFDINNLKLISFGKEITLTRKEIKLMILLVNNANRIVTYKEIESFVWDGSIMTNGALKTLVNSISVKAKSKFIVNLSQVGYKLIS